MHLPYLTKLFTVDTFEVFEVDGHYVRDHFNREFTNFGQHYRYPFIPKHEFWIDKESSPGEVLFFVEHLLVEWHAMDGGLDYDHALAKGDHKEKMARSKTIFMHKLEEEQKKWPKEVPKHVYKERIHKDFDGVEVWIISGEAVRDLYYIDFTEGGHHFVYPWVPFKQVWLDDDLTTTERDYVLLHELHERYLMWQGQNYFDAHASSSAIEYVCRKSPEKLHKEILKELTLNQKPEEQ